MDQTATAEVNTASNHAISIVKSIGNKLKSSGKSDVLSDILDLQAALIDLQVKQQELVSENAELRRKNAELEEILKVSGELVRGSNALYLRTDKEKKEPYCLSCWGYDRKLVGLIITRRGNRAYLSCKICAKRSKS
jgi:hypothetical protein